jgi:hypothetical protein
LIFLDLEDLSTSWSSSKDHKKDACVDKRREWAGKYHLSSVSQWTPFQVVFPSDCRLQLLVAIIKTVQPKIDYAAVATYMGESE